MIRVTPYKGRSDAWLVDIRVRLTSGIMHRERYKSPARTLTSTRAWAEARERAILVDGPRPEESQVLTLEKFSERWLEEHARANKQKASTIDKKETVLRLHILPLLGKLRMDEIDLAVVQKFKADLAGKTIADKFNPTAAKLSAKSIKNILSDLSSMLGAAVEWEVIASAPRVKTVRAPKPKMEFFELDDYAKIVAAAERIGPVALAAVLLAAEAGLRRGELEALEHRDLDMRRKVVTVERNQWYDVVDTTKGGRSRRIPMTQALHDALNAIPGIGTARVLGLGPQAIDRIARRCGGSGMHKLRHTFGSHLAMAGVPIIVIKELMGHESIQTTERYMHLAPASEAEGIRLLAKLRAQETKAPREIRAV